MRPIHLFLSIGFGTLLFAGVGLWLYDHSMDDHRLDPPEVQNWLLFLGAILAYLTFVITRYAEDAAQRANNALTAIQALRTDKDYLRRAMLVKDSLKGDFTRPVSGVLRQQLTLGPPPRGLCQSCGRLHDPASGGPNGEAPVDDFPSSVDFMMNHYEFLAAAARRGALDLEMLRQTIRSTSLGLATAFEPYIRAERRARPRIWQNFVWMVSDFDPEAWQLYQERLGPVPDFRS